MRYCPNCNCEVQNDESKFCSNCGAKLPEIESTVNESATVVNGGEILSQEEAAETTQVITPEPEPVITPEAEEEVMQEMPAEPESTVSGEEPKAEPIPVKPGNNYGWSVTALILSFLCCGILGLPMAIYAVYCSSKVDKLYALRNYPGSYSASRSARNWSIGSIIVIMLIFISLLISGFISGAMMNTGRSTFDDYVGGSDVVDTLFNEDYSDPFKSIEEYDESSSDKSSNDSYEEVEVEDEEPVINVDDYDEIPSIESGSDSY